MYSCDSNYDNICCPFCDEYISENKINENWVKDLEEDDNSDFFQCQKCKKFFKAELFIYREYEYIISEPTKEEIKIHNLINGNNENGIIKDLHGQMFIWENLF